MLPIPAHRSDGDLISGKKPGGSRFILDDMRKLRLYFFFRAPGEQAGGMEQKGGGQSRGKGQAGCWHDCFHGDFSFGCWMASTKGTD